MTGFPYEQIHMHKSVEWACIVKILGDSSPTTTIDQFVGKLPLDWMTSWLVYGNLIYFFTFGVLPLKFEISLIKDQPIVRHYAWLV